jgi:UDP-GlcNAc:undecaprenyl-phosphate/decaprenyl-phosphate GlcNAc-1-phosphate transferase
MGDRMSFLLAFCIGIILTPPAATLGSLTGMVDRPGAGELKIHARPIPVLGGVAVLAAALSAAALLGRGLPWPAEAGVLVAFLAGLLDDRRPVSPWVRVAWLAVAAGLVAWAIPMSLLGPIGRPATFALVLACTNGVNLLDGQDGLAGGLSAVAALALAVVAGGAVRATALALAGALVAFLLWNRPPARIFLGNGGAYGVGAVLAAVAAQVARGGLRPLLAAGLALSVVAMELTSTVLRRLGSGHRLSSGDRGHSYDVLSVALKSRTASTLVLLAAGTVLGATAALVGRVA